MLTGDVTKLVVRFGISPLLNDLIINGQQNLIGASDNGSRVLVSNNLALDSARAAVHYTNATFNAAATDKAAPTFMPDTVEMRNQAQTEQIELESNSTNFTLELGAEDGDGDGDGLPDDWEDANGLDSNDDGTINPENGPAGGPDGDNIDNITEYRAGLNPQIADAHLFSSITVIVNADRSMTLDFPILSDRRYRLWYSDNLLNWQQLGPDIDTTGQAPDPHRQINDTGAPITGSHPSGEPRRFYRMEIILP